MHGIATSGRRPDINASLAAIGVADETVVMERGDVRAPSPTPTSSSVRPPAGRRARGVLRRRRRRLGPARGAPRADAGVGLLSGGYGGDELTSAGAFRVYRDAAELHASLDELGI